MKSPSSLTLFPRSGSVRSSGRCPHAIASANSQTRRFYRHAFGDNRGDGIKPQTILDRAADSLPSEDRGPVFLGQPFEARGLVHAIAEHRVISRDPPNPHIAHDCIAQMYETDGEWRQALGFELTIERFAPRLGEKGPATCSFDIVGLQMGRVSCQAAEGTRSLQAVPSVSGPILN